MGNLFEMSLLLDFYGQLLTERQFELMDLHYNHDYSLAEISEELNISRQGVHDGIKKARNILEKMENRLALIGRFMKQQEKALEATRLLKDIRVLQEGDAILPLLDKLEICIDAILNQN
jgi:predicted DNA-binding protein YlxM (UPF0122 family)